MKNFLRILPFCFLFNCTSKAQECKELYLNANRTYEKYLFNKDFSDLDSTLLFVDQALQCAPDNLQTNLLKVRVLYAYKKYKPALEILRTVDSSSLNPDINTMKGFTFKILNLKDSAAYYFQRSLSGYSNWLKSDPTNYSHLLKYLHMVYMVKGDEELKKEINRFESFIIQNESNPNRENTIVKEEFRRGLIEIWETY